MLMIRIRIVIAIIILLIISSLVFELKETKNELNKKIKLLQTCIEANESLKQENNLCYKNYNETIKSLESKYKTNLDKCNKSKTKLKQIYEYKLKHIPKEKVITVEKLKPCNIKILDDNDIIKETIESIGALDNENTN